MSSENNETSEPHRLLLKLSKRGDKCVTLSNLSIYCT